MAIEFIGTAASATGPATAGCGLAADPDYPARIAGRHEEAGYDWLLIDDGPGAPDGVGVAGQVLTTTSRLGVLLAHRPGVVAPTMAARQYATLDAFHPGRVAMLVVTGDDDEYQRDGDGLGGPGRARRTAEFLHLVTTEWRSAEPFDFRGEFYRVEGAWSAVRPGAGGLPLYIGAGAAPATLGFADVITFGPAAGFDPGRLAALGAAAAGRGRSPRFGLRVAAGDEAAAGELPGRRLAAGITSVLLEGYDPEEPPDTATLIREPATCG